MGLGLLWIGMFFAYIASFPATYPCYLAGFLLIFSAIPKLSEYKRVYRYAWYPLVYLIAFSLYGSVQLVAETFFATPVHFFSPVVEQILYTAFLLLILALNEILLFSTARLCESVGLEKDRNAAVRNMVWMGIYYLFLLIQSTGIFDGWTYLGPLNVCMHLFIYIMLLILFASCYRKICPAEETDEPKPSRFAFFDRLQKKADEKQRKATEADIQYYLQHKKRKKK